MEMQAGAGVWHACWADFGCYLDWLDHWQTMLSGIGAIAAALLSIKFLRKQIEQAADLDTGRRARRVEANRARLPLHLSDCVQYAAEAIEYLDRPLNLDARYAKFATEQKTPVPILPNGAILAFEAIIENTENADFANLIADMISQMQVLDSRLRGLASGPLIQLGMAEACLINAAKVQGYAESMFDFARRETQEPPRALDWNLALNALKRQQLGGRYEKLALMMARERDREQASQSNVA